MVFRDLIYGICQRYPGGPVALATRMRPGNGEQPAANWPQIFRNKVNPNCDTNHLSVQEMEQVVDLTDSNIQIADYFAEKAGALVVRIEQCDGSDMALLDGFMAVMKELGEFSETFRKAWADGRITQAEFAKLSKEARDVHARLVSLMIRIEQITDWPAEVRP